ncbi:methyltransferase domain-containing protein [Burkholderia vietnamiensis]|uniref:methyltransferase domain-containing protein n=1 Tax=Burkholderia vietnamiensis TaxID=60552 RepID=UPI001B972465|nr:methyltransferase domain-containing protein [Burkholderia vietnamiensis]MBR8216269.1 class I SAM-dependent methyltransferase [Burkholderia vietnamiensis]
MLATIIKDHTHGDAYLNLSCPVCGCLPVPHVKHGRYFIDRCPDCGFAYVRNVPAEQLRVAAFGTPAARTAVRPRTSGRLFRNLDNWLHTKCVARYARGCRRLLQIGFVDEHLLPALRVTGDADIAPMKSVGLSVAHSDLFDQHYPGGHFDFVVGIHVLDRVHHLGEFIREVRRVLSTRRRVYFVVSRSNDIEPPERLWQFSVPSLREFLAYHGFRAIFARSRSIRVHLSVLAEKLP